MDLTPQARSIGALGNGATHRLGTKEKGTPVGARGRLLFANAELLDNVPIARRIALAEIVEQASAVPNEFEQTKSRAVILGMRFEMLRQVLDPLREQRDLDFGRSRVCFVVLKCLNGWGSGAQVTVLLPGALPGVLCLLAVFFGGRLAPRVE